MPASAELDVLLERRLEEGTLAIEATRLLAQFRKSAGGPPRFVSSPLIRLSFEKVGDREELRVHKVNPGFWEERVIIIAEEARGAVQYLRVFSDNFTNPEIYVHSQSAVRKAEEFLRGLNIF